MMITGETKKVIPLGPGDAGRVGSGCFYLDLIVWLNAESIELGDDVGFNYGCYVNGFGGLTIGDKSIFGPYTMIHTANHGMEDPDQPIQAQGWNKSPVTVGKECWIGMGTSILPGVTIGDGVVIGAGSVVAKDLPSYAVAVGNPCTAIRSRR
jgi:maltose O-acetyltransferase